MTRPRTRILTMIETETRTETRTRIMTMSVRDSAVTKDARAGTMMAK